MKLGHLLHKCDYLTGRHVKATQTMFIKTCFLCVRFKSTYTALVLLAELKLLLLKKVWVVKTCFNSETHSLMQKKSCEFFFFFFLKIFCDTF